MVDILILVSSIEFSQLLASNFTFHLQREENFPTLNTQHLPAYPKRSKGISRQKFIPWKSNLYGGEENDVESRGLKSRGPLGNRAESRQGQTHGAKGGKRNLWRS